MNVTGLKEQKELNFISEEITDSCMQGLSEPNHLRQVVHQNSDGLS